MRHYFADLLEEKLNHAIAYDAATPEVPWWIYPQEIDAWGTGSRRCSVERSLARADRVLDRRSLAI